MKPPTRLILNLTLVLALLVALVLDTTTGVQAAPPVLPQPLASGAGKDFWRAFGRTQLPVPARASARPAIRPSRFSGYALNRAGLAALLANAPGARSQGAHSQSLELSLPAPDGTFQRFLIAESNIMGEELSRSRSKPMPA